MRKKTYLTACAIVFFAIIITIFWGMISGADRKSESFNDGIEQIDLNTIYLKDSKVEVHFTDVILSNQKETRKLIVSEQEATVSTELTDRIIKQLDFDFMKKTQKVSYTGKGYFVVDLDKLTKDCIVEDEDKKIITIKIDHAYLEAIEINPNNIIIDDVKEGLLARGEIKLSLNDYNAIEKDLRNRLEEKFDTVKNGQEADEIALKMVREVYEPIIKAIDKRYDVIVEFR